MPRPVPLFPWRAGVWPDWKAGVRVLHLGKYYPPFAGGMERFLGDLLPALAAEGVEPAALVHAHDRPGRRQHPFPVWRVPAYGRLLYTPVSPAFPLWLARMIRHFRPHLLHLHLPNPSAFWVLALPAARRLPWVIHWHADVVASTIDPRLALAYRLYRPWEQALLRRAVKVIATSPPYRDASAPLRPWRDKTEVVPLGIDPARLAPPGDEELAWAVRQWGDGRLRLLCVGRLTYYKGHAVLLAALRPDDGIHLICVGAGERLDPLRQRARQRRLDVHFTGALSDARRNALLATCDVLVLPSVERTEAFGVVLLEAMAYGKPVIAARVPGSGMGWVVEAGVTGWLVPPGDAAALAQVLQAVRRCPVERRRRGEAGRVRLSRRYHIRTCARSLAAIYREVCG